MDTKLVIFDCDGTLIDSEYINNKATSEVLLQLGHKKYTTEYCIEHFAGCSIYDIRGVLESLNVLKPQDALKAMQQRAMEMVETCLQPIKKSLETVRNINIPKCVASNGERELVLNSLKITGFMECFSEAQVFTREIVQNPKPFPDLYLYAANKMGSVDPQDCLVLEDSVVGVRAAKAAGMKVIGLNGSSHQNPETKAQLLKAGAFAVIENFADIKGYIT